MYGSERDAMEISSIPGIRLLPAVKQQKDDPHLSAVFDIENACGPQQDGFSRNGSSAAGGQDETADAEEHAETTGDSTPDGAGSTIDLLA